MFGRCQHLKEDRTLELTRVPVELLLHGHKVLMNSTPRCSIFMWRKTRINYTFIFELAPTKDLWYRDVFLICTTSMTAVMGVLFVHLSLVAKGYSYSQVQAIPAVLLLVPMLRNLEYVACYYITGSFKTQNYRYCMMTKNYRDLAYAVSYLPYYWRAMQVSFYALCLNPTIVSGITIMSSFF